MIEEAKQEISMTKAETMTLYSTIGQLPTMEVRFVFLSVKGNGASSSSSFKELGVSRNVT
jgi:hypothetical protein